MRTVLFILSIAFCVTTRAQSSDSIIAQALCKEGVTFTHDNKVTLLTNGQEKFDDLFKAIEQAKSSVHLEYFNFRNDSIASLLFQLLERKASEGVEVRALFDAFGNASNNRPLKKRHIDSIRAKGIEIYKFDPITFPWVNHALSRDHRKIVVIDGEVGYTGGMNVADYYIKGTKQVGKWNDMHCRIEGLAVNTLQSIFLKMWNKTAKQNVHGSKYFRGHRSRDYIEGLNPDTCDSAGHKTVGMINREPRISNKIIRDFYVEAINAARDSLKIINPYFTLNRGIKKALRNAIHRGVKVEIMLSTSSEPPARIKIIGQPQSQLVNSTTLSKKCSNILFPPISRRLSWRLCLTCHFLLFLWYDSLRLLYRLPIFYIYTTSRPTTQGPLCVEINSVSPAKL